jgi:hypothetical protein
MLKVNTKGLRLDLAVARHKQALSLYAETAAQKMEAEAKARARWTDRTANARNSIQGSSGWDGHLLKIMLYGNMNYSVFLELAHEKKYAILKPTIERNKAEIGRGYGKLVRD